MTTVGIIKQQRRLRWMLFIELLVLAGVLFLYSFTLFPEFYKKNIFYDYFNPPNIAFYTDDKKQLRGFKLQTLSEPIIKREALLYWAELATTTVNTLSSSTYEQQLKEAFADYFTENGKNSLIQAYQRGNVISDIVAKKLSVTSVVQKPPILMGSGRLFGRRIWKIQIPILVTYESLSEINVNKQLVTLLIVAVPTTENPLGISIDQYESRNR